MKGCIFLHRRFTALGHNIVLRLKEKYGVEEFCAYVSQRASYNFLKSQKDIKYTGLILDEEIHKSYVNEKLDMNYLRELEKEYGLPNLWAFVAIDRVLMYNQPVREYPYNTPPYTHEELLRILQVKARAIIAFLEKEKPDFLLVSQALGGIGSLLLYHVAKKMGIKTWSINMTSLKNTYVLSNHYIHLTTVKEKFKNNLASGIKNEPYYTLAKNLIESFKKNPEPYYGKLKPSEQPVSRTAQFRFLIPANFLKSIYFFLKIIYRHFTDEERFDYSYITPWNYIRDHAKRKIRNFIGANNLYDKIDFKENFAFFPLQYEPEISLLLWAPFKTNQLETIRQIAKSLPIDYKLYVKEHPLMVQYRPRSYYKEIKKIPNVKLINPSVTSFELLPHTKLVITITGSLGLEATFMKKPVITLGDLWFNYLSFIKYCPTMETLPYVIKEQLENFGYDENELFEFVAAILEESVNIDYVHLWEEEPDSEKIKAGMAPLADLLAKKLGL
ncbi:MAG: hypothetical protein Q8Q46_03210 [Candidatus Giovannonibacteria bacterium]|nr:hypothetical protein [Candidatus Giovannonibacteria bacterium]